MGGQVSRLAALTEDEIAIYKREFQSTDADSDGYLSFDELVSVNKRVGYSEASATTLAKQLLAMTDTNKDGKISWKEFVATHERDKKDAAERYDAVCDSLVAQLAGKPSYTGDEVVVVIDAAHAAGDVDIGLASSLKAEIRNAEGKGKAEFSSGDVKAAVELAIFGPKKAAAATAAA